MHHNRRPLSLLSPTLNLLLHIRPILDILPEMANMAPHLLVRLEAKRNKRDEAKGKPFPALHDAAREVAAVLTLHGDVFGAFEGGVEDWMEGLGEGGSERGVWWGVPWVPHVKKKNMVGECGGAGGAVGFVEVEVGRYATGAGEMRL
jgi:hypothetical protein